MRVPPLPRTCLPSLLGLLCAVRGLRRLTLVFLRLHACTPRLANLLQLLPPLLPRGMGRGEHECRESSAREGTRWDGRGGGRAHLRRLRRAMSPGRSSAAWLALRTDSSSRWSSHRGLSRTVVHHVDRKDAKEGHERAEAEAARVVHRPLGEGEFTLHEVVALGETARGLPRSAPRLRVITTTGKRARRCGAALAPDDVLAGGQSFQSSHVVVLGEADELHRRSAARRAVQRREKPQGARRARWHHRAPQRGAFATGASGGCPRGLLAWDESRSGGRSAPAARLRRVHRSLGELPCKHGPKPKSARGPAGPQRPSVRVQNSSAPPAHTQAPPAACMGSWSGATPRFIEALSSRLSRSSTGGHSSWRAEIDDDVSAMCAKPTTDVLRQVDSSRRRASGASASGARLLCHSQTCRLSLRRETSADPSHDPPAPARARALPQRADARAPVVPLPASAS